MLSVIKTQVPMDCDDLVRKDLQLQQYGERIEKLSQQDKLSKLCMDAGFLNVVEIGQYFITKDTEYFSQFTDSVACREFTVPREDKHRKLKVGSEETPKLDPYWKLQPGCCTLNMELRSEFSSLSRQYSLLGQNFSWIK